MIASSLTPPSIAAPARPRSRVAFGLTRRALLLLLAGALWLVPAFFFPRFAWGMAVWDLAVLVMVLVDRSGLPAPTQLSADRIWRNAPALANQTEVEIGIEQQGTRILSCHVTDDLGEAFVATPPLLQLFVYPNGRSKARYTFTARERGDRTTGQLYLRYRSRSLGLIERWAAVDLRQQIRVYPSVRLQPEESLFLARSRQIELQLRLRRQRGLGRDFESLREYREGDDVRDICWTATARRGSPITRQYQVEKSQPVWILLDAGRLMQLRVEQYTRLDYATTTALALAQLAMAAGDRVGLLGYGAEVQQRLPLGRGAAQARQIMESLAQLRGEPGEADHLHATVVLNRMQPRRSLILWITDMAETSMRPEVVDGAATLMKRHLVLFVAMRQMQMTALAAQRPETRRQMFDIAAAQELVHRRMLLMAQLREMGALTLETDPKNLTAAVLNRYLEVKEQALL
jgi:uncharacterized protein (DUF58 family)